MRNTCILKRKKYIYFESARRRGSRRRAALELIRVMLEGSASDGKIGVGNAWHLDIKV